MEHMIWALPVCFVILFIIFLYANRSDTKNIDYKELALTSFIISIFVSAALCVFIISPIADSDLFDNNDSDDYPAMTTRPSQTANTTNPLSDIKLNTPYALNTRDKEIHRLACAVKSVVPDTYLWYTSSSYTYYDALSDGYTLCNYCFDSDDSPAITTDSYTSSTYILNANTRVIHKSTCSWVPLIDNKNKRYINSYYTIPDALADGYTYCEHCH